ncbi:MAG TPA: polymer-forming cytoskeletal protein [Longimicrobium sp.]|nr:polymer-forming cytoskeletal protein [Longimicrobium sp.]
MRTDRFARHAALLLAAGLLAGGTPRALAAQDTLAPPAAPAAVAAPEAPHGGDRIALRGTTVAKGQVVDGDIVSLVGDVRVEGEVVGNVTVGKGDLILAPGAVIHGDAVVTGGRLLNEGGRVYGEMRVNDEPRAAAGEARQASREAGNRGGAVIRLNHGRSWLGSFGEGVRGIFSTAALGLLLAGLGAALVFYARPQLERMSHVVRTDTLRAGAIGIAASVLGIPVFVLGGVALALTIVGIPLLLLWIPFFWPVVLAACVYGALAVAHALGERTAEKSGSFEARHRNAYTYMFTGVAILLAPMLAAHLLEMTVVLAWAGDLLEGIATLILWLAGVVGFGAAVITRLGTRATWPWKPREYDPVFDGEPAAYGGSHA